MKTRKAKHSRGTAKVESKRQKPNDLLWLLDSINHAVRDANAIQRTAEDDNPRINEGAYRHVLALALSGLVGNLYAIQETAKGLRAPMAA